MNKHKLRQWASNSCVTSGTIKCCMYIENFELINVMLHRGNWPIIKTIAQSLSTYKTTWYLYQLSVTIMLHPCVWEHVVNMYSHTESGCNSTLAVNNSTLPNTVPHSMLLNNNGFHKELSFKQMFSYCAVSASAPPHFRERNYTF